LGSATPAPEILPYWQAFWALHRSRSYLWSGLPQGLLLSEIRALLDEYEIEGDGRRRYVRLIQALDAVYLKQQYGKAKKEQEAKQNGTASRTHRRTQGTRGR
jgi:hypothetical protein